MSDGWQQPEAHLDTDVLEVVKAADKLSTAEAAGVQIIARLDDATRAQLSAWLDGYHV
jgi:hypothetical protein